MQHLIEKHINEFFRDITSLGGVWFYLILIVFVLLLLGQTPAGQLLAALISIYIVAVTVRLVYFKDRPAHEVHGTLFERTDASSFPSIHAARASSVAYILVTHVQLLMLPATIVAVLVCVSRIYLKKHYLVDVIGGVVLGIMVAATITNFLI